MSRTNNKTEKSRAMNFKYTWQKITDFKQKMLRRRENIILNSFEVGALFTFPCVIECVFCVH